jgi:hypothetical protein
LVVLVGVEGELAEWFALGGDDPDVEAGDEHEDSLSVVGSPDSDVVESAVAAEGDDAGFVDSVLSDSDSGCWCVWV